jgi:hypothetical protein
VSKKSRRARNREQQRKTMVICDMTGDECKGCGVCNSTKSTVYDNKGKNKTYYNHGIQKCYEVTFKVWLPSIAQHGFLKKLISLGFLDARVVDVTATLPSTSTAPTAAKTTVAKSCPLNHDVTFPMCNRVGCDYYNWSKGCLHNARYGGQSK